MDRHQRIQYLKDKGIVAIIRADQGGDTLVRAVEALVEGGIHCVEITMTTPGALACIETASHQLEGADVLLGVGSVLDAETARLAILAGAEYVVCPVTVAETITMGHRYGVPVLPGALTPTEIFRAWELGGDLIKVFPATLGGLDYIKAVKAPMPQIPLVPTGGVDADNLHTFVEAGVAAVGVGSALVSKKLMAAGDFVGIKSQAQRFADAYAAAKSGA
ncbi:MAG: bifunctional 4-hydroxy-2-oxoglutarate aldolase/2-dehydro-3-deoxy-phosphogluconate aldolase [Candidatus Hydrogenedentes bacterium]|nr:bifunctional 4-hydroxy-2-oxoglutarate aldolase/2-dehydro-3-deoxy-phosphogluconate aldolase [Candidatus Hydrogenedentota bacterium]